MKNEVLNQSSSSEASRVGWGPRKTTLFSGRGGAGLPEKAVLAGGWKEIFIGLLDVEEKRLDGVADAVELGLQPVHVFVEPTLHDLLYINVVEAGAELPDEALGLALVSSHRRPGEGVEAPLRLDHAVLDRSGKIAIEEQEL